MFAAGPEGPESLQGVPVIGLTCRSPWIKNRRDQRIWIVAVNVFLRLFAQQADKPGMNLQHAKTPAGGPAPGSDFLHHVEMGMKIHLPAVAPFGLDHPEQASRLEIGDVLVWQSAQRLGFGSPFAEDRR